jgi:hypothetical protein
MAGKQAGRRFHIKRPKEHNKFSLFKSIENKPIDRTNTNLTIPLRTATFVLGELCSFT